MPCSPLFFFYFFLFAPPVIFLTNNKLWDRQVTPEDSEIFHYFFLTGLNVFTETLNCCQKPTFIQAYLQSDCKIKWLNFIVVTSLCIQKPRSSSYSAIGLPIEQDLKQTHWLPGEHSALGYWFFLSPFLI